MVSRKVNTGLQVPRTGAGELRVRTNSLLPTSTAVWDTTEEMESPGCGF